MEIWGTGTPRREFLHSDDLAEACLFCMQSDIDYNLMNVGSGQEVSIRELANMVARTVGYKGSVVFNTDMPDGTPRKLLDSSRINEAGWRARISLEQGLQQVYEWYLDQREGKVA